VPIAENVLLAGDVSISHPDLINLYGCSIGEKTKIGAFVEIQKNALVGARCKISSNTFVCEGVTIEDECFILDNRGGRDRPIMIPITQPYFGPEEGEAARRAVESGWVTQGPKVAEFERAVAGYCDTAETVAVSAFCLGKSPKGAKFRGTGRAANDECPFSLEPLTEDRTVTDT
jgi:hypothetical protein